MDGSGTMPAAVAAPRRFYGPYRVDGATTEDYPGLVVSDGRQRGGIRTAGRMLELWAFARDVIDESRWAELESVYGGPLGITPNELRGFFAYLLSQAGEFARLICVLADVERCDADRFDAGDDRAWWDVPEERDRLRACLVGCVAALDDAARWGVEV